MVTQGARFLGALTSGRRQASARVLVTRNGAGITEHRVRVWDELGVRLRAQRLDRQLCRGESPESSVALALRAERLVQPRARKDLAGTLRAGPQRTEPGTDAHADSRERSWPDGRRHDGHLKRTPGEPGGRHRGPFAVINKLT